MKRGTHQLINDYSDEEDNEFLDYKDNDMNEINICGNREKENGNSDMFIVDHLQEKNSDIV